MTSADRRARTSRGGRPAPRAKCPSGRCAGRGRAGRASGARRPGSILPNGSSTFRLPPDSRSSGEASVPVSQFHGRSGLSHPIHSPPPPSRHSATVPSSSDICLPTFRRCFPIHLRHGAESGRTAKGMTGYAVEFHIPTEHFMSSLTKVSSTTRARHRAWIRRHARGVWRAAIEAGAYRTERFVALAMVQWPGPSIYPAMSCAETLKSEEPGELKGAERK